MMGSFKTCKWVFMCYNLGQLKLISRFSSKVLKKMGRVGGFYFLNFIQFETFLWRELHIYASVIITKFSLYHVNV